MGTISGMGYVRLRRGAGFFLRAGIIPLFTLAAIVYVAWSPALADNLRSWAPSSLSTEPKPYPIETVAEWSALILAEGIMLTWVLRPWSFSYSWRRAGVAWFLTWVWTFFVAATAPLDRLVLVVGGVWLWISLVSRGLFLLFVASAAVSWQRARDKRRLPAENAAPPLSANSLGPEWVVIHKKLENRH